jgi:glycerol uptake facilitator-like aquaporin
VRVLAAEFVGTFALVFAGCGAIMVDTKTQALGHVGVAISFGLVIMVMIYAVGHISGAHFNPAVSFAFALSRHFPWPRLLGYGGAQLLGALAAAAILRGSLVWLAGPVASLGARDDVLPAATSPTSAPRCRRRPARTVALHRRPARGCSPRRAYLPVHSRRGHAAA